MKKYLAVFVAVFVLALAGSALAAGHDVVIISPTINSPTIDISSPAVQNAILTSLANLGVPAGTTITIFDENSGTHTTVTTISPEQQANIPSGQVAAALLGTFTVNEARIYTFEVTLSNLNEGDDISIQTNETTTGSSSAAGVLAAAGSDKAVFLDDSGNVITKVPANKRVNVAMYMEPGKTYSPVISTSAPAGNDPGSSGGGCSAGFTVLALAVLGGFIAARKK